MVIVPFMSLLFIVMAIFAILRNVASVPAAFALIFEKAFSFRAAGSGGGWDGDGRDYRSGARGGYNPNRRYEYVGFRLCCSAGPRE